MIRRRICALLALGLAATGCGATGIPYCGDEELHASVVPAAVPGLLGLLPAKKGEGRDPGEIVERQASYPFARVGLLLIFPVADVGWRLAPDRAHRTGFEVYADWQWDPYGLFDVPMVHLSVGGAALFAVGNGSSFVRTGVLWTTGVDVLNIEATVWRTLGRRWEVGFGVYLIPEFQEMPVFPVLGALLRL